METLRVVDLFAGLGGFHKAMEEMGHECVFASELDPGLQNAYRQNFRGSASYLKGDIRAHVEDVPTHDLLCAGFPCQPFSKSGNQDGANDVTRGTLFHEIVKIAARRRPSHILLENVGNFERHDSGNTWATARSSLEALGYTVKGTGHKNNGGHGLVSPHHFGHPHHRERFFAVASLDGLPGDPFPRPTESAKPSLHSIVQEKDELSPTDKEATALTDRQRRCIDHWNAFLAAAPDPAEIPGPLWGMEFGAVYKYRHGTPWSRTKAELRLELRRKISLPRRATKEKLLEFYPSHARTEEAEFPDWKVEFIAQSRRYFREIRPALPNGWRRQLSKFPPSLQKLEWNCAGEKTDLWRTVMQFRPSGLRAKRYTTSPALVSMTVSQVPLLGPERRFLTETEGRRLQGFPDTWVLPPGRERAFAALGNGVHVDVVKRVTRSMFAAPRLETIRESATDEKRLVLA